MNLLKFLYWLQKKEFYLWIENDSLKFKQLQPLKNKDEIFSLLKSNKEDILNILKDNNIHSPNIKYPHILMTNRELVPLSFAQERLFFIDQYEKGTNAYNIPFLLKLNPKTNIEIFKESLKKIIRKHKVLRTVYSEKNGDYFQKIIPQEVQPYTELKIEKYIAYTKKELDNLIKKSVDYIFDLKNTLPIKIDILKFKNETFFSVVIHHIAFDGWSSDIFLNDLEEFYNEVQESRLLAKHEQVETQCFASKRDKENAYPAYKDFAEWQKYYLTGKIIEKQLSYWKNQLANCEILNLPTDKPRQPKTSYSGNDYLFKIDTAISAKIKQLAKNNNTTLYCILLSAFYILLYKYTQQNDLIIGTPIANRHYNQIENLIGFFVNTLPIRIKLDEEKTVKRLIQQVTRILSEAQSHQDIPFEKIVNELNVEKDLSRNAIFQVMFSLQDINDKQHSKLYSVTPLNKFNNIAKFDLDFTALEKNDDLNININYATSIYEHSTIKRMANHYINILKSLTSNTDVQIKELNILSPKEYQMIVYDWNKTEAPYSRDKTIHALFEEQVEKTPDNIAVVFEDCKLSYRELNNRANQLAHTIRKEYKNHWDQIIKADTLIGIYIDRSLEMIISILGILKAGATFVPFDKADPEERLKFKINDCGCKMILTSSSMVENLVFLTEMDTLPVSIDSYWFEISKAPISISQQFNTSADLAYIIYTSGSTGKPKGVMISHYNVLRLFNTCNSHFNFTEDDVWTMFHSYSFDFSVWEIWGALLYSGKLVIPTRNETRDTAEFYRLLKKYSVTVLNQTPSAFYQLSSEDGLSQEKLGSLKYVVFGGEALNIAHLETWFEKYRYTEPQLVNMYGITETTVHVTYKLLAEDDLKNGYISNVGKKLNDLTLYILDCNMNPLPIGIAGELYIGGAGLARGYLYRDELTSKRFVSNPFEADAKLYKTGDTAKYLPDGEIEYLGRNDSQVQLHGFRIELGEIESRLSEHSSILRCTVIIKEKNDNKYLVAYYVVDESTAHQPSIINHQLTTFLAEKLPEYMIPLAFLELENLPLTSNGKLDRKALPDPEFTSKENYVAPHTDLERQLAMIWKELLGIKNISIKDNFFKLGGDSILCIQLSTKLRNIGLYLNIKDIFEFKTIENIAKKCRKTTINTEIISEKGLLEGTFNLLPIQIWFFDKNFKNPNHWNQSFLIKTPKLDINKLLSATHKLVNHHDIFRAVFPNNTTQKYLKKIKMPKLNVLDKSKLNKNEFDKILTTWQNDFNIKNGKLWSIGYIHGYSDRSARIFFAAHHLIIDTVSWRIIAEDLQNLYNGNELPTKTSSYRQWINTICNYPKKHKAELNYWESITSNLTDYSNLANDSNLSGNISFNKTQTNKLLTKCNQAYNTEINVLLLSALSFALKNVTGNESNCIILEGHGRENIANKIDISHTVGWFTAMYPIQLETKLDIRNTIIQTKENIRKIPNKGIGFGSLLGYKQLPKISFNYLGQFNTELNKKSNWIITPESSGGSVDAKNIDKNIIEINGWIVNNRLEFNIKSKLSQDKHNEFTEIFKSSFSNIINHCFNKKNHELTYSDLPVGRKIKTINIINNMYKVTSLPTKEIDIGSNTYIINFSNEYCYIIDPSKDIDLIIKDILNRKLKLKAILLTHGHIDHVSGVNELQKQFKNTPVILDEKDIKLLAQKENNLYPFLNPLEKTPSNIISKFTINDFKIINVPGHTQGSVCFYFEYYKILFTGDTDFDIIEKKSTNYNQNSLSELFQNRKAPKDIVIMPGHEHLKPETYFEC